LAKDAAEKCGLADTRVLAHFPGRKLERLNFQHPFLDRKILGVLADYVTMDTGTGVVHTAPSHGAEDFLTGVKYGLDVTSNVDEMPETVRHHSQTLAGRSMLVRRAEVFQVECVVRGYLVGSGWKDYLRTGEVCGHKLAAYLQE